MIKTVGQRTASRRAAVDWGSSRGPIEIAQGRGELLPRFERAARGEQRRGVEMVLLGLGSRVQLNQRLRTILEKLRRRCSIAACRCRGDVAGKAKLPATRNQVACSQTSGRKSSPFRPKSNAVD